jgi:hypothetical protein
VRTKTWEWRFAQLVKLVGISLIFHRAVRLESPGVRHRLAHDGALPHDASFKMRPDRTPSAESARLHDHHASNRPLKMTTQSVNSRARGAGMRTYLDQAMRGAQGLCCSRSILWVLAHVCARFRAHMSSARPQGGHPLASPNPGKAQFPLPIFIKNRKGNKI